MMDFVDYLIDYKTRPPANSGKRFRVWKKHQSTIQGISPENAVRRLKEQLGLSDDEISIVSVIKK